MWFLSQINHQETAEQNMAFRGFFFLMLTQQEVLCIMEQYIKIRR